MCMILPDMGFRLAHNLKQGDLINSQRRIKYAFNLGKNELHLVE
jgi:hypothetical protein